MDLPRLRPPALSRGDTLAIIAPAGPIENRDAFERGVASIERLGFSVRYNERIFDSRRYLAGDDAGRAEDLMRHFEDPGVRGVLSLRGGYGSSRLISLLDEKRLRTHCKLFMGFSDLTTLHLFFRRRFGWITVHGPMVTSPALANLNPDEESHLVSLWTDPGYRPHYSSPELEAWHPGVAEGRLVGGCLSLVVASLSTPYEIKTQGEILFLEEVEEPPYRIDRMLTQLQLARKLDGVAGIVLGSFFECLPRTGSYTVDEVLREILEKLGVPVLAGFAAGHGPKNWPFPLGARVRLDANRRELEFLEAALEPRP